MLACLVSWPVVDLLDAMNAVSIDLLTPFTHAFCSAAEQAMKQDAAQMTYQLAQNSSLPMAEKPCEAMSSNGTTRNK